MIKDHRMASLKGLARITASVLMLLMALQIMGCGQQTREGLSPQVEFLWRQHPNPHVEAGARRAATEAKSLLVDHDDDIELHIYYIDRLGGIESDSLEREYQRRLDRDPNNAVNIVLEAYVRRSGPYLAQVMPAALERDSTTAEVLAFGSIAMLGSSPPDSMEGLRLAVHALELHPGSYQAHVSMATWENKYGRFENALKYARSAQELNPWRWEPVSLEYSVLAANGREEEAVAMMEEFYASQPTNSFAYKLLSRYYKHNKLWKKLYDLEMIIDSAYPEDGYAFQHAANAAYQLQDIELVFAAWEKAAEYGFFDMDYVLQMFDDEERQAFVALPRYQTLTDAFAAAHEEAQPQRKADALDRPLNVKVREFTARSLDQQPVRLSRYQGQIVVLDFWSSSERNHPLTVERLKVFREKYPEVQVVSVNVMERLPEDQLFEHVQKRAEQHGIEWPVWIGNHSLAERMRIKIVPVFAVIDEQGYARYRTQGYQPYIDEILGWMVDAVREGEAETVAEVD